MLQKICKTCNHQKNISEFHKCKKSKYWVRTICKDCECKNRRERYKKNSDKSILYQQEYRKSDKWKEIYRLARSRRRKLVNWTCDKSINYDSTQAILKEQEYKCILCYKDISEHSSRHLDHINPLSKWGEHIIKNVQWLCCKCNLSKWSKNMQSILNQLHIK